MECTLGEGPKSNIRHWTQVERHEELWNKRSGVKDKRCIPGGLEDVTNKGEETEVKTTRESHLTERRRILFGRVKDSESS